MESWLPKAGMLLQSHCGLEDGCIGLSSWLHLWNLKFHAGTAAIICQIIKTLKMSWFHCVQESGGFPEKRAASGFWTLRPYTKNFTKTFILKFPRYAFSKESLCSAIWKASGKEKLIRFLEKMISWKVLFGNFRRELCSSLCCLMKQAGTFLCLHLLYISVHLFSMHITMYLSKLK